MRPIDDLTMYAHGLLEPEEMAPLGSHLEICASCTETVRRLRAERAILEKAAASEAAQGPPAALLARLSCTQPARPRTRTRLSPAGLAAAAVLLSALAWLLFRAPRPREVGSAAPSSQGGDGLDRLVAELKSSSALRREIATLALKAHGGAAIGPLTKAKADPALIDACRSVTPEMRAIEKTLETVKISLAFEKAKAEDVLASIREVSGLNLIIDAAVRQKFEPGEPVTLKLENASLAEALKRICGPLGLKHLVTPEKVVLLTDKDLPEPEGRAPIRIPGARPVAPKAIDSLGSDSPEVRDRAASDLRRMGFAAEGALWAALDSGHVEVRARAADLLQSLYTPGLPTKPGPLEERLRTTRITIDLQNSTLPAILDFMASTAGVNIVIDPVAIPNPEEEIVSYKVRDIVLVGALRLMLLPRNMDHIVVGDLILVTRSEKVLSVPPSPSWTTPEEARRIESLLADLASADPGRHAAAQAKFMELGKAALGPLGEAAGVVDGAAGARCASLRLKVVEGLGGWLPEPSGADVQALSPAQRELLARKFTLRPGTLLKDILSDLRLKASFKAGGDLKLKGTLEQARVDSVLRAVLRPAGLDFHLDGETIVVDTAANVRAALSK